MLAQSVGIPGLAAGLASMTRVALMCQDCCELMVGVLAPLILVVAILEGAHVFDSGPPCTVQV